MTRLKRDRTLGAIAVAGRQAGKSLRQIAVDLYARERVDACWHAGSPLRAKTLRLLRRAWARAAAFPVSVTLEGRFARAAKR